MALALSQIKPIAIALGDPGGIGLEVALKAIASELPLDLARYILIGDEALVATLNRSWAWD